MGDLQPTDEYNSGYICIAVVYQSHLALKLVKVVLHALPWFHPNHKELVVVPLEHSPRHELIIEGVSYIFKTSKRVLWE